MANPIRPGWLSRGYRIWWKPAKLPLSQNPSIRTDVFLSAPFQQQHNAMRVELSSSWTLGSTLLDPGVPSCKWIRRINYTSEQFSYFIPGQPFLETFILLSYGKQDHASWLNISFLFYRLIHGPLGLHFEIQMFPGAYELDELIPPLTIQLLHSWTTFKETVITSFPQQPGPHIYGWTFTPVLKSATQCLLCLQRRIFRSYI